MITVVVVVESWIYFNPSIIVFFHLRLPPVFYSLDRRNFKSDFKERKEKTNEANSSFLALISKENESLINPI